MVPSLPAVCPPARQVPAAHHEPVARARLPSKHRVQADHQEGRRAGQGPGNLFSPVVRFHGIDVRFLKYLSAWYCGTVKASVEMQRLSYPTKTVLSNKNGIVLSFKDSPRKLLGQQALEI